MITKRPHNKSRNGCRTCKARKVKCDEKRPVCSNCARRNPGLLECDFDHFLSPSSAASSSHHHHSHRNPDASSSISPTSSSTGGHSHRSPRGSVHGAGGGGQSDDDDHHHHHYRHHFQGPFAARRSHRSRALEMRLFHQWMAATATSMAMGEAFTKRRLDPEMVRIYTDEIPTWAFDPAHEYLLDNLLATAALHLWHLDPVANADLRTVSHDYASSAALKYADALAAGVDGSNAEPLLASAMLTQLQSKVNCQFRDPSEPYDCCASAFRLNRGMLATRMAVLPYIPESSILRRIMHELPLLYPLGIPLHHDDNNNNNNDNDTEKNNNNNNNNNSALAFLPPDDRADADTLLSLIASQHATAPFTQAVLRSTLSYILSIAFGHLANEPPDFIQRRIRLMPSHVPADFLDLLSHWEPLALALLARYFALMKPFDCDWWSIGMPERELAGIATVMPPPWLWLLDWPNRRVSEWRDQSLQVNLLRQQELAEGMDLAD